jgi:site-specific DNA recombinase
MKLILIARVSDVEQRKALPAQKLRLMQYAASIDQKAEYHEFDESAHKDVRREFAKLVQYIKEQQEPCAVVFDKIDRFTRDSSQEEVRAINGLIKAGKIELHFPSDNLFINYLSPAADLFRLGIGMALAKYYSDSIRDNVKRRFEQLLDDKTWIGYAPIGYMNINRGTFNKPIKDIEVDVQRAQHVVTIFEKRAIGMSYDAIADVVNSEGLTSKSGRQLNKSAIEKITRNPFYHGTMLYMGKLYPHKYQPLISKQLYNKCQDVRDQRYDKRTAYRSLPFALNNLASCKECGCTVSSFNARNSTYIKCSKAKYKCGNLNTSQALVMPLLQETVSLIPLSNAQIDALIRELKIRYSSQQVDMTKRIETVRSEYDTITKRLKTLTYERLDALSNGKGVSSELFDEMVEEMTNRQQVLNHELIRLTDSNKGFIVTASYLLDLAQRANELFMGADNQLKQKLLRFLLSNVELYDKKLYYIVNDPYKSFIELNKMGSNTSDSLNWCAISYEVKTLLLRDLQKVG